MAVGTEVPPWLRIGPEYFNNARNAGAEAGLGSARIRLQGQENADRLAMESQQLQQKAQEDSARLSQAERIAAMENQTRKEISEQNHLQESQQLEVQRAYHQAQIGLARSKVDDLKALADGKAKQAAMAYSAQQAFAKEFSETGDAKLAFFHNPVPANVFSAITRQEKKTLDKPTMVTGEDGLSYVQVSPNTFRPIVPPTETETTETTIPASPGSPAVPETTEGGFFGIGSHKVPSIPAVPATDKQVIRRTRKIPSDDSLPPTSGTSTNPVPFKEGQRIQDKSGKHYIVTNGVPVPVDENGSDDEDQ